MVTDPVERHEQKREETDLHKIQRYKSFSSLFYMVFIYSFGMFYFRYSTTYLGTFDFSDIARIFQIEMEQSVAFGLLTGCLLFGGGCGALLSLLFLKLFSRRQCLLVITAIAFVANLLTLIPNFILFFVCRFVQGLCAGLYSTITPMIIKEILPIQISGTFGAFSGVFLALGAFMAFFVQYIVTEAIGNYEGSFEGHWRIVFSFPFPTLIIEFLMLIFVYDFETPKYLLQNGREEDCIELLQRIYKQEYVEEVLRQKKIDLGILDESDLSVYSASTLKKDEQIEHAKQSQSKLQQKDEEQIEEIKIQRKKTQSMKQQGSKQYTIDEDKPRHKSCLRRFIAMNLSILQQLAGQIAVVPYGGFIVSIVMPQYATLIPVIYLALSLVCTMVVSFLLSRFGRKPLLQIGTLITIVSLALITAGFFLDSDAGNIIVIVGIFVWMIATGLAMNPIIWLYIAEIIQPTFITFPTMTNWLFAVLIGILFPILEDAITAGPVFAFFVGYCVLSLILNQKLLVETKDRTETQIYTGYDQIF